MAGEIGMTREGLCRALAEDANPGVSTLLKIVRALRMWLRVASQGAGPGNRVTGVLIYKIPFELNLHRITKFR